MTTTYANPMMYHTASAMSAEASFSCAARGFNAVIILLGAIIMASIFVSLVGLAIVVLAILVLGVLRITCPPIQRFERRNAN